MKKTLVNAEGRAKISWQYKPIGENHEITLIKGRTVPPAKTGKPQFVLVDKTQQRSLKGGK